ncbi:hypothetical protein [Bradyrhizobium manausense]|uniref:hypothetical protein n=1 Tax=Bradyrhizobium manausense TaxID=989370 RepID=UPI0009FB39B5|nr:hypothetical protein [Bradyrhizobium manausense]
MTERQSNEQELQIARYRILEREVTDPLAAHLLHDIVSDLEANLRKIAKTAEAVTAADDAGPGLDLRPFSPGL